MFRIWLRRFIKETMMLDLTPLSDAISTLQQHEKDALARDQALQTQIGTLNGQVATLTQQVTDLQNQNGQEPDTAPLLSTLADIQATADQIGQAAGTPATGDPGTPATPTDGTTPAA